MTTTARSEPLAAPVPRYAVAPPPFGIVGLRVCNECGALVLFIPAHNGFHNRLASLRVSMGEHEDRLTNTRERLTAAERKLDGRSRPRGKAAQGADGT